MYIAACVYDEVARLLEARKHEEFFVSDYTLPSFQTEEQELCFLKTVPEPNVCCAEEARAIQMAQGPVPHTEEECTFPRMCISKYLFAVEVRVMGNVRFAFSHGKACVTDVIMAVSKCTRDTAEETMHELPDWFLPYCVSMDFLVDHDMFTPDNHNLTVLPTAEALDDTPYLLKKHKPKPKQVFGVCNRQTLIMCDVARCRDMVMELKGIYVEEYQKQWRQEKVTNPPLFTEQQLEVETKQIQITSARVLAARMARHVWHKRACSINFNRLNRRIVVSRYRKQKFKQHFSENENSEDEKSVGDGFLNGVSLHLPLFKRQRLLEI